MSDFISGEWREGYSTVEDSGRRCLCDLDRTLRPEIRSGRPSPRTTGIQRSRASPFPVQSFSTEFLMKTSEDPVERHRQVHRRKERLARSGITSDDEPSEGGGWHEVLVGVVDLGRCHRLRWTDPSHLRRNDLWSGDGGPGSTYSSLPLSPLPSLLLRTLRLHQEVELAQGRGEVWTGLFYYRESIREGLCFVDLKTFLGDLGRQ